MTSHPLIFGDWQTWAANSAILVLVILAIPVALSVLLRKKSAALRHRIWCLAFCGSFCAPVLTLFMPQMRLSLPEASVQAEKDSFPQLDSKRDRVRFAARESESMANLVLVHAGESAADDETPVTVLKRRATTGGSKVALIAKQSVASSFSPRRTLVVIWALGCVTSIVLFVVIAYRKKQLLTNSRNLCHDAQFAIEMTGLRHRLGVKRRIRLYESHENMTPMTWGVLWPIILVPASYRNWSTQRRHIVLLHELMHVKRFDYFFQSVGKYVGLFFWFNPLVWYGLNRLRTECERACDDAVVQFGERASDYAKELVDIAESHSSCPASMAIAMARKSQLEDRIQSLFDKARSHLPLTRSGELGLIAVSILFVCLLVVVRPVYGWDQEGNTRSQAKQSVDGQRKTTDMLGDPLAAGSRFRFGSQRFRHPTIACELALSPDEKTLVTAGYETMIVWDADTGRARWRANLRDLGFRIPAASYGVRAIAFKGDGTVFYTPGKPNEFNVWNTEDGTRTTVKHESLIGRFLPRRGLHSQARSIDVTSDGKK